MRAFVTTKGYGDGPDRSSVADVTLAVATARSPDLIRAALSCLRRCHVAEDAGGRAYGYRKAGVVLSALSPADAVQGGLFVPEVSPEAEAAQARLMATVDALNRRFGKRAVVFGSMGSPAALRKTRDGTGEAPRWEMRREHMTPRYTTRWDEVEVVQP